MSKYHSQKTVVGGIAFDSRKEANRYAELMILQNAGVIKRLERQKEYILLPQQKLPTPVLKDRRMHQVERCVKYIADFVYEKDGEIIVEDVKGYRTSDYTLKRKLMLYIHGIQVMEI